MNLEEPFPEEMSCQEAAIRMVDRFRQYAYFTMSLIGQIISASTIVEPFLVWAIAPDTTWDQWWASWWMCENSPHFSFRNALPPVRQGERECKMKSAIFRNLGQVTIESNAIPIFEVRASHCSWSNFGGIQHHFLSVRNRQRSQSPSRESHL